MSRPASRAVPSPATAKAAGDLEQGHAVAEQGGAPTPATNSTAGGAAPGIVAPVEGRGAPGALPQPVAGSAPPPRPDVPDAAEVRQLARRVRASKVLTPSLRRYWLAVLPHLNPADRHRLDAILRPADPLVSPRAPRA